MHYIHIVHTLWKGISDITCKNIFQLKCQGHETTGAIYWKQGSGDFMTLIGDPHPPMYY